jgi:site-specific recombinase XerD
MRRSCSSSASNAGTRGEQASLAGLRDRALLLLGFAGGFRSELVALDVSDLDERSMA